MKKNYLLIILAILISFINCEKKMNLSQFEMEQTSDFIDDAAIDSLQPKKILFGHASVGFNIIDGIEKLAVKDARLQKIAIQEITDVDSINTGGLYHIINRKNGFPRIKCDNFKKLLQENNFGAQFDIAFFKFCYVDFDKDSDVQAIFDYYVETIDSIKTAFPRLKIVHVTTPLYAHAFGTRGFIGSFVKKDLANIKRNQFNELMRKKYQDRESIFDLAQVESEYPDGTRVTFKEDGTSYYSLAHEHTDDGGHLNAIGSFYAARTLLKILANTALQ